MSEQHSTLTSPSPRPRGSFGAISVGTVHVDKHREVRFTIEQDDGATFLVGRHLVRAADGTWNEDEDAAPRTYVPLDRLRAFHAVVTRALAVLDGISRGAWLA